MVQEGKANSTGDIRLSDTFAVKEIFVAEVSFKRIKALAGLAQKPVQTRLILLKCGPAPFCIRGHCPVNCTSCNGKLAQRAPPCRARFRCQRGRCTHYLVQMVKYCCTVDKYFAARQLQGRHPAHGIYGLSLAFVSNGRNDILFECNSIKIERHSNSTHIRR